MILDPYIQKLIRERLGCALSRPSEFEALALDVETATGEHIGVNTLKRLFGLLSEVTPTETTLNVDTHGDHPQCGGPLSGLWQLAALEKGG